MPWGYKFQSIKPGYTKRLSTQHIKPLAFINITQKGSLLLSTNSMPSIRQDRFILSSTIPIGMSTKPNRDIFTKYICFKQSHILIWIQCYSMIKCQRFTFLLKSTQYFIQGSLSSWKPRFKRWGSKYDSGNSPGLVSASRRIKHYQNPTLSATNQRA